MPSLSAQFRIILGTLVQNSGSYWSYCISTYFWPTVFAPLGEASFKKNWFFSEKIQKGGAGVSPNPKFPNQKKTEIFLPKGGGSHPIQNFSNQKLSIFFFGNWGGGLSQSKISLSEKTEFFVGFFLPKGGGSHLFPKGFIKKYRFFSSNTFFLEIFR